MNPDLSGEITLKGMEDYLAVRQKIVVARESFFSALRQHMTSTQQKRNGQTGDILYQDDARVIDNTDWIADPARGYLTIKENLKAGRVFRISLLQMGQMMRLVCGCQKRSWRRTNTRFRAFRRSIRTKCLSRRACILTMCCSIGASTFPISISQR